MSAELKRPLAIALTLIAITAGMEAVMFLAFGDLPVEEVIVSIDKSLVCFVLVLFAPALLGIGGLVYFGAVAFHRDKNTGAETYVDLIRG